MSAQPTTITCQHCRGTGRFSQYLCNACRGRGWVFLPPPGPREAWALVQAT